MERLFDGKPPPGLNPKTVVSVTGLAYLAYNYVADRGVIGIVRVTKDEKSGVLGVQQHVDIDEGLYDGVMNYAAMVRGDRKARDAQKRYRDIYATDSKETNGHGQ